MPVVAVIGGTVDPDTGSERELVVAELGAVPPEFPDGSSWTVRLN